MHLAFFFGSVDAYNRPSNFLPNNRGFVYRIFCLDNSRQFDRFKKCNSISQLISVFVEAMVHVAKGNAGEYG